MNSFSKFFQIKIFNEAKKSFIDKINTEVNPSELPFNDIFGDKRRIIIPIKGDSVFKDLMNDLEKIKNFERVDMGNKAIIKKIKTQEGRPDKTQKISIGKAINSLSIPETKKKLYRDWFATHHEKIYDKEQEFSKSETYSIILSRSPVDVLRMSDIGSIHSCHSLNNDYAHCAVEEANNGGPVAYLVNKNDLEEVDDLQNVEIFQDRDRGVGGIDAISRIRVRRYSSTNEDSKTKDIAIPETRSYGDRVLSNFYEIVKDFLYDVQKEHFSETEIQEMFENRELEKRGGSYADSSDSQLFNKFFDQTSFKGDLHHSLEDSENSAETRREQFEEELQSFKDRFKFKHCVSNFDVEDIDDIDDLYYNMWGALDIDVSDWDFVEGNINALFNTNSEDINYAKGDYRPHYYNDDQNEEFDRLQNFFHLLKTYESNILMTTDHIESLHLNDERTILQIGISYDGAESFVSRTNTHDYLDLLRLLEQIDKDYKDIENVVKYAMVYAGIVETNNDDILSPEEIDKLEETNKKNRFHINKDTASVSGDFHLKDVNEETLTEIRHNQSSIVPLLKTFLNNFIDTFYEGKPKENNKLKNLHIILYDASQKFPRVSYYQVRFHITYGLDIPVTKSQLRLIDFLNRYEDDIQNAILYATMRVLGPKYQDEHYYNNLEKVYGDLFKN